MVRYKNNRVCSLLFAFLLLACTLVTGLANSPDDAKVISDKNIVEVARARATLVAFLCYAYETDNGRFPRTWADLHWPVDYTKSSNSLYGFDFDKANSNPLDGGVPFVIRPVILDYKAEQPGIRYSSGNLDWWILSTSGPGSWLSSYDVLKISFIDNRRSLISNQDDLPTSSVLYISAGDIRNAASQEGFDLKEFIDAANLDM